MADFAPVIERCENCRAICLCNRHDTCTCMVENVMLTNLCGCTAPDSMLAGRECTHTLCHDCTDKWDAGTLEWDGAPTT